MQIYFGLGWRGRGCRGAMIPAKMISEPQDLQNYLQAPQNWSPSLSDVTKPPAILSPRPARRSFLRGSWRLCTPFLGWPSSVLQIVSVMKIKNKQLARFIPRKSGTKCHEILNWGLTYLYFKIYANFQPWTKTSLFLWAKFFNCRDGIKTLFKFLTGEIREWGNPRPPYISLPFSYAAPVSYTHLTLPTIYSV